jgi:hypothetical protein
MTTAGLLLTIDASDLSQSNHYQISHLLLRSPKRTLAHGTAASGINSITLLHPQ